MWTFLTIWRAQADDWYFTISMKKTDLHFSSGFSFFIISSGFQTSYLWYMYQEFSNAYIGYRGIVKDLKFKLCLQLKTKITGMCQKCILPYMSFTTRFCSIWHLTSSTNIISFFFVSPVIRNWYQYKTRIKSNWFLLVSIPNLIKSLLSIKDDV